MRYLSKVLKNICVLVEEPTEGKYTATEASTEEIYGKSADILLNQYDEKNSRLADHALKKADEIIRNAIAHAETIVSNAEKNADEAYRQGFMKGKQEAQESEEKKEDKIISDLSTLYERLENTKENTQNELRAEAIKFAFQIAEKIICHEIDKNDKIFVDMFKNAAEKIAKSGKILLKVGQREYPIACKYRQDLEKCIDGLEELTIKCVEQDSLCVIESAEGCVDFSVGAQFLKAKELIGA